MLVPSRVACLVGISVAVVLGGSQAAQSQSAEARIKDLEKRLLQLEQRLAAAEGKARNTKRTGASGSANGGSTAAQGADANSANPNNVTVSGPDRTTDNPEFSVVRENVATLSARSFELATGAGYTKTNSVLQSDRAFTSFFSGRFGVFDGVELGVNVPYYYSYRYTQTSPSTSEANRAASLGDTTVQLTALVSKESASLPAVNVSAGVSIPTGARPYYFGKAYQAGQNPIDPLFGRQSRGEWAAFGNVQLVKTYDPVVLFAGVGVDYAFETTHQGYQLKWPLRFTYNAGFSFVVSNTSTIGFALIGSYQGDLRVNGQRTANSQSEPIIGRLTLTQRLAPNFYIEPSVGLGMSKDSPTLNAALTIRKRF